MYGPDVTFLGVERCDLDDLTTFEGADVVVIGTPVDVETDPEPGLPQQLAAAFAGGRRTAASHAASSRRVISAAIANANGMLVAT